MVSPNPVPSYWRPIPSLACRNSSQIILCSSMEMPSPVSDTAIFAVSFSAEIFSVILPFSVNLTALFSRLSKMLVNNPGSILQKISLY
ncbi:MAG: hypothetical protein HYV28_02450 [Ignavibacteriales bacterium]|nr:hypothetical protein [Ignavibacteriales bacterium]